MRNLLILLTLILFPLIAVADDFSVAQYTYIGSTAFDYASGLSPNTYEVNPVLTQNKYAQAAIMTGITVAVLLGARYLHRSHPKIAKVLLFIGSGAHITAGIHNIRLR